MITHNRAYINYNPKCTYTEHHKKKQLQTKHFNSNNQKEGIYYWINLYNFTHFFTLRFQIHNETERLDQAEQQLRRHIVLFEKKLFGRHWNNKHLFFIAFAEKGRGCYWHFHILFNFDGIGVEKIINALVSVEEEMKLSSYSVCLDTIDHLPEIVIKYSTKEVRFNQNNIGDTSTIIPSTYLFDLPYEKTYHYQFNKTHTKTQSKCLDIVENNQTDQQIEVTEEVIPNSQMPILQKICSTVQSIFTAPINYVGKAVNRCLLHCFYSLPVDDYYLYHIHRQLYENLADSDEGYG